MNRNTPMREADMKSDIRRVMNRMKRRAAPTSWRVIRSSRYFKLNHTDR